MIRIPSFWHMRPNWVRSKRNVVSEKYVVAAAVGVVEIVNRRFKELWEKRPLLFPQLRQFPQRFSAPAFALRC
jgi:hypothetical protein